MNTIQAGYTPATASLNASSNAAQSQEAKNGNWLMETGGKMAIEVINGLDIKQSWKDKAVEIILDKVSVGFPPGSDIPGRDTIFPVRPGIPFNPPVSGTPAEEGNLARQLDELKDAFKKFFQEVMSMVSDSGSAEGSKKAKDKAGAGGSGGEGSAISGMDFFTSLAKAIGSTLQQQADIVKEKSTNLFDTVQKSVADQRAAIDAGKSGEGMSKEAAQRTSADSDNIMALQTDVSAESMKLNFLSTALQSALKSVSDSLNTMGRG
ncbi:MAG: hypothetical protein CME36_11625 [unclassified Hahellaceae]|nr:hypothetical protein [Hahellaceae bacterium]